MFNIKWGGICAGAAFVLAFALSLILGQTNLLIALLRAVVFAALFFGLGTGIWSLIKTFIPELLSSAGTGGGDIATSLFSTGQTGSRVNITVDDTQSAALPEQNSGPQSDVGDFNELFTPKEDIDQISATGYTERGEAEGLSSAGEFSAAADGFASATEGLAGETGEFSSAFDNVSLSDEEEESSEEFSMDFSAFVPGGLGGGSSGGGDNDGEMDESDADADPFSFFGGGSSSTFDEPAPERRASGNKPMKLEGDFDAREIAAGLRTVLQKDKK